MMYKPRAMRRSLGPGVVRVSAILLELAVSLLLARILGVVDFGIFTYALAYTQIAVVFAAFGNPLVSTRYVAHYKALNDGVGVMHYVRYMQRKVVTVFVLVLTLVIGIAYLLDRLNNDAYFNPICLFMVALLPWALIRFQAGCVGGAGWVARAQLPEYIVRPVIFLSAVPLVYWWNDGEISVQSVVVVYILGTVAALMIAIALNKNATKSFAGIVQLGGDEKQWLKSSWLLTLFGGVQILGSQIDIIFLAIYEPPDMVAVYRVAYQIMSAVGFALTVVNLSYAPRFATHYANKDIRSMQSSATKCARLALLGVALPASIVLVFGGDVIPLAFGKAYVNSNTIALILILGLMVSAGTGSVSTMLNMSGHERETLYSAVAGLLLAGILCMVLIPEYGAIGAATASAVSLSIKNIYLYSRARKLLGVRSFVF